MIGLLIYIVGIFAAYKYIFSKWEKNSKFERVWFSVVWPCLIPLFIIHMIRYYNGDCKK